jgi:hypothetical protein
MCYYIEVYLFVKGRWGSGYERSSLSMEPAACLGTFENGQNWQVVLWYNPAPRVKKSAKQGVVPFARYLTAERA